MPLIARQSLRFQECGQVAVAETPKNLVKICTNKRLIFGEAFLALRQCAVSVNFRGWGGSFDRLQVCRVSRLHF